MEGALVGVGKKRLNSELNITGQLDRGQILLCDQHESPSALSLHLVSAPAHVAGYTLPSADGKQITSRIKGLLSVHGLTHTCTNTHSRTQDNRASAGARVGGEFRELRVEEGWGSMALPHTKAALK